VVQPPEREPLPRFRPSGAAETASSAPLGREGKAIVVRWFHHRLPSVVPLGRTLSPTLNCTLLDSNFFMIDRFFRQDAVYPQNRAFVEASLL